MKKVLLSVLFLFLLAVVGLAQENLGTAMQSNLGQNMKYQSYISEAGDTISLGDTIKIGKPSGIKTYNFITQGGEYCTPIITGKKVIVERIWSAAYNKKMPKTLYVGFKGYGLLMVYIDYENALEYGEVVKPIKK